VRRQQPPGVDCRQHHKGKQLSSMAFARQNGCSRSGAKDNGIKRRPPALGKTARIMVCMGVVPRMRDCLERHISANDGWHVT